MAKKDFTGVKAGQVFDTIADATEEKRKERKTYTEQEAVEFMQNMKTTGRKGVKLPRINLAFTPENYDYIRTMSRAAGMNYTDFVNMIIKQHMEDHAEQYQRAIEFRNSL